VTNDVHITPEGLETVRKELDQLVTVKRPAIVDKIKAARELGDLSENFEYHAAKNDQGFMEARVKELEAIIKNHVLIETVKGSGVVNMGSTVRFSEDGGSDEAYRIVGPAEADPKAGTVSYESALGKALLGHRVGEEVEVKTPNGSYRVRIVGIE
jgi:transcription elongation factor GreA